MIRVFYGDDRVAALKEVVKILGEGYENIEGAELSAADLPEIFRGTTLFSGMAGARKILIRDLFNAGKDVIEKLPEYADTEHEVILLEQKLDKRTAAGKEIANTFTTREFKIVVQVDRNLAFNIFDRAFSDGAAAVKMLREAEKAGNDPYMILGAWSWKAIDRFKRANTFGRPGEVAKEKRVLRELSKLDIDMKTSAISSQPWLLLSSFLLRVSSL